ncbi:MAG: hypothetical protein GY951_00665, partial [Psychromonas sp.]|nr:hypothetical protein [Psychromonas sp.]
QIQLYLTSTQGYPEWISALACDNLLLKHGRPNFQEIYPTLQFTSRPTIFTCGPKTMMKEAKQAGKSVGWNTISEQF